MYIPDVYLRMTFLSFKSLREIPRRFIMTYACEIYFSTPISQLFAAIFLNLTFPHFPVILSLLPLLFPCFYPSKIPSKTPIFLLLFSSLSEQKPNLTIVGFSLCSYIYIPRMQIMLCQIAHHHLNIFCRHRCSSIHITLVVFISPL